MLSSQDLEDGCKQCCKYQCRPQWRPNEGPNVEVPQVETSKTLHSLVVFHDVFESMARESAEGWGPDSLDTKMVEQLLGRLREQKREIKFLELDNAMLRVLLNQERHEVRAVSNCNDRLAAKMGKFVAETYPMRVELA